MSHYFENMWVEINNWCYQDTIAEGGMGFGKLWRWPLLDPTRPTKFFKNRDPTQPDPTRPDPRVDPTHGHL